MNPSRLQLLEKMIALYSWSSNCVDLVEGIADSAPSEFGQKMASLEGWIHKSKPDNPDPAAPQELASADCYRLYEIIVGSDPLCELFVAEPLFSGAQPAIISHYARLADISPDSDMVLRTKDVLFMRIMRLVLGPVPPSAKSVLLTDLTRLIVLNSAYREVTDEVLAFAEREDFHERMSKVERGLEMQEGAADNAVGGHDDNEISTLIGKVRDASTGRSDDPNLRDLLLSSPRLSTMDPAELRMYSTIRDDLPTSGELLRTDYQTHWDLEKRSSRIAEEAFRFIKTDDLSTVELSLDLRIEAAQHFLGLRRYAKLDALSYTWPKLSALLRDNRRDFFSFERQITSLQPVATGEDQTTVVNRLLEDYREDETLAGFLRLRPFFREVSEGEIRKFDDASSAVVQMVPQQPIPSVQVLPMETYLPSTTAADTRYNIHLAIKKLEKSSTGDEKATHAVTIGSGDSKSEPPISQDVSISPDFVHDIIEELRLLSPRSATRVLGRTNSDQRSTQYVPWSEQRRTNSYLLQEIGTRMYDQILPGEVRQQLLTDLRAQRKSRIVLQISDSELSILPWETLYITEQSLFLSLIGSYSVVRYYEKGAALFPITLQAPLRILALFASPVDLPPLPIEQDEWVLVDSLRDAQQDGQVELRVIRNATLDDLRSALREFHPHVLYFDGHGTFSKDGLNENEPNMEGALVFENSERRARLVQASVLKAHMAASNISLIILDACDTGSTPTNRHVTGLAGSLVDAGVPAVIATTRAIFVESAAVFTKEFFSAFVDGYSLEASVIEARKALSAEDWDWSPHALFVSTTELDSFKLSVSTTRRRREMPTRVTLEDDPSGRAPYIQRSSNIRKPFGKGHALVIGSGGDLPFTANDAKALAEILSDPNRCGYPPNQVHLLIDSDANQKSILQHLDRLASTTDAGSTAIVYFSGHGWRKVADEGVQYFLMPNGYDTQHLEQTSIPVGLFAEKLRNIPAEQLLVLLDCSNAGGIIEAIGPHMSPSGHLPISEFGGGANIGRGRVIIAASSSEEMAYGGQPHSVFTAALLEALSDVRVSRGDGFIRVSDIAMHAREVVPPRVLGRQHPVLYFEAADDFVVANGPLK